MSMNQFMPTCYSSILYQARFNPHGIAVSFGRHDVTYEEFASDIERVTRRLNSMDLPPSGVVAVHIAHMYLHWMLVIALARLGLISVSVHDVDKGRYLELLKPDFLLTDRDTAPSFEKFVTVSKDWLKREVDSLPSFNAMDCTADDPVRIILSSGTTGTPKKILITHGQLQTRIRNIVVASKLTSASRITTTIGLDASIGFQLPLSTWTVGGTVILCMPGKDVYSTLVRSDVNLLYTSPVQLAGIVDTLPPDAMPLSSLTIYVGGGRLSKSLSQKARIRLTSSLYVAYGSSEAAGGVARAHATVGDAHPGATGYILPWIEVQVVDPSGQPVANGTTGEVRIRGAGCVQQYLDEPVVPDGVQKAFRDGWFYPGDIGSLTDTGLLSIVGRARELMNLGGMKIAPDALEDALRPCPGVSDIAAFAVDYESGIDKPWVAVVQGEGFQRDDLAALYKQQFPKLPPVNIANIDKIPRNTMGKVLRQELRSLVKRATGTAN